MIKNKSDVLFVGGSISIDHLDKEVLNFFDQKIKGNVGFVIGDAAGVDKQVQHYLFDKKYRSVIVYFAGRLPRNNVGNWSSCNIRGIQGASGFDFHKSKDIAMSEVARSGCMIWDGMSRGTKQNIVNMVRCGKNVDIYLPKISKFFSVAKEDDLDKLKTLLDE